MKHTLTELVKRDANFSHYRDGNLYYEIICHDTKYLFPIDTQPYISDDGNEFISDLGNATLNSQEKGLTLMRYIRKAINDKTITFELL